MKDRNVVPRKVFYFSLILSLLFLMLFSFQSCQEVTAPEIDNVSEQLTTLNKDVKLNQTEKEELVFTLKSIAKGLAILFNDEANRKILENAINSSDKKEQILEASEFLNEIQNLKVNGQNKSITFREAITNLLPNNERSSFKNKILNLKFGLIDIFLPSKEYRKNWRNTQEIQVVALGYNFDLEQKEAIAYSNEGQSRIVPTNEKPNITTLVVYPSEKKGNYYPVASESSSLTKSGKNYSITSVNSEDPPLAYYRFNIKDFKIGKEYDDFLEGETMELYFKYQTNWGSGWSNWTQMSGEWDCDVDEWKDIDKTVLYSGSSNYQIRISAYDWDFWSSDDQITNGYDWDWSSYPYSAVSYFIYYPSIENNSNGVYVEDYGSSSDIDYMGIRNYYY